jgi:hypothetical protein
VSNEQIPTLKKCKFLYKTLHVLYYKFTDGGPWSKEEAKRPRKHDKTSTEIVEACSGEEVW